jgi:hypothetical protein
MKGFPKRKHTRQLKQKKGEKVDTAKDNRGPCFQWAVPLFSAKQVLVVLLEFFVGLVGWKRVHSKVQDCQFNAWRKKTLATNL